jgi:hypothetical protein
MLASEALCRCWEGAKVFQWLGCLAAGPGAGGCPGSSWPEFFLAKEVGQPVSPWEILVCYFLAQVFFCR